ncbi:MAG: hypothetical protein AAF513_01875 [Pseudomonadota bacterium]
MNAVLASIAAALLLLLALIDGPGLSFVDVPLWQLQQTSELLTSGLQVAARLAVFWLLLTVFTLYFALYLSSRRGRLITAGLCVVVAAGLLPALFALLREGSLSQVAQLYILLALPAVLLGLLLWVIKRAGRAAWLVSGAIGLIVALGLGRAAAASLADAPLPIDGTVLTSTQRVDLVNKIRAANPRDKAETKLIELTLDSDEMNRLVTWGLSLGEDNRHAFFDFRNSALRFAVSLPLPVLSSAYLNVSGQGQVILSGETLFVRTEQLRIGDLPIPARLVDTLAPGLYAMIARDPRYNAITSQIDSVTIKDRTLIARYYGMTLPDGMRGNLFRALAAEDTLLAGFSEHIHNLRRVSDSLPQLPIQARHQHLVSQTFALAHQRVVEGSDPQVEARIAIVSLAIVLGHHRLSEFITHLPSGLVGMGNLWREAPLQGRRDWTRHFWLSAGIAILADQGISSEAGRLKEELDAQRSGGSGFSFTDLGADMAGVAFATWTTADYRQARKALFALQDSAAITEFVPELKDLPEGLSLADLERRYGGVDGAAYRQLEADIQARIDALYNTR